MNTAILAGGGATRFGGKPKGLELVGGRRILDRLVDACVEAFGGLPLLVANDPEAAAWRHDLRVVADLRPGLGALGGIHAALIEAPAPVVCIAWDMPFVSADLVRLLGAGLEDADACLPASGSRRGVEPLCAAYGVACQDAIERSVEGGDLRAIGFHRWIRVRTIGVNGLPGDPGRLFFNINTPADLATAQETSGPFQT